MLNLDDVYEYVEQRDRKDNKFKENISRLYKKNAKWIFPFYDQLSSFMFFWLQPVKNKKYFFLGHRFSDLIATLPKNEICIIGGPRQLMFCLKNNIDYVPNGAFWRQLNKGFNSKVENKLISLSLAMCSLFKKLADPNAQSVLIVENDSLPIQRTFCNISSFSGIKTVCIQHGLFQSKTDAKTIDGWKCDYFICYDNNQKMVISGLGVDNAKIIVGGFYEPVIKTVNKIMHGEKKVCFLGQPWFKYGDVYKDKYMKCISILSSQCKAANISFSFKPHPWEQDAIYLKEFDNVFNGTMSDVIAEHDVFFSFTSTALLEVTMAGKVAIQIYDELFACDRFEQLGYSYSIPSEELNASILSLIGLQPFTLEIPDFNNLVYQVKKLTVVSV